MNFQRTQIQRALQSELHPVPKDILDSYFRSSNICLCTGISTLQDFITEFSTVILALVQSGKSLRQIKDYLPLMVHPTLASHAKKVLRRVLNMQQQQDPLRDHCCCQEGLNNSIKVSRCVTCNRNKHDKCLFYPETTNAECPECFLKNMDPFLQVGRVLAMRVVSQRDKFVKLQLDLTCIGKEEQVALRCVKIHPDKMLNSQIGWPDVCELRLNNIELAQMIPLQQNSSLKRRPDQAYYIPRIQYSKTTRLQLRQKKPYDQERFYKVTKCRHLLTVMVVKTRTLEELKMRAMQNMVNIRVYQCAVTQRFKIRNDTFQVTKQKVGLTCPFTKDRIKLPVRGANCRHIECFDMSNFLSSNESSKLYKCPVGICAERCHNLVVDPILYKVIQQDISQEIDSVEFTVAGYCCIRKKGLEEAILIDSDSSEGDQSDKLSSHEEADKTAPETLSLGEQRQVAQKVPSVEPSTNLPAIGVHAIPSKIIQNGRSSALNTSIITIQDSDCQDQGQEQTKMLRQERMQLQEYRRETEKTKNRAVGEVHFRQIKLLSSYLLGQDAHHPGAT